MLNCPKANCRLKVSSMLVEIILGQEAFRKYKEFNHNAEVLQSGNKKFCPYPDCVDTVVEVKNPKSARRVECQVCYRQFCFQCHTHPWHEGKTCKENKRDHFKKWALSAKAQNCPNCKIPVEKDEGCQYMKCPQCHHQWCWKCGRKTKDHAHIESKFFLACFTMDFNCTQAPLRGRCDYFKFTLEFLLVLIFMALIVWFILAQIILNCYRRFLDYCTSLI